MMVWKRAVMAALAVLAVVVGASASRAGDVIKLGLNNSAPTMSLELKPGDDAQVQETFWHGGWRSGYGWRGGWGGYNSFYRPSFYGGGWGGYNSFYRPSYYGGWGGYNSFYRPSFYYGGYSSYYYPSYYYTPSYYCPIGLSVTASSSLVVPGSQFQPALPSLPRMDPLPQGQLNPMQPLPNGGSSQPGGGTFQYDGGPSNPVPMPKGDVNPPDVPNKGFVPGEGRLVSLPVLKPTTTYTYPAYGDKKK